MWPQIFWEDLQQKKSFSFVLREAGHETLNLYFIYLFIYCLGCSGPLLLFRLFSSCGEWGLLSSCSARASHCGGFSYFRAWV